MLPAQDTPPDGSGDPDGLSELSTEVPSSQSSLVSACSSSPSESKISRVVEQLRALRIHQDETKGHQNMCEVQSPGSPTTSGKCLASVVQVLASRQEASKAKPNSSYGVLPPHASRLELSLPEWYPQGTNFPQWRLELSV